MLICELNARLPPKLMNSLVGLEHGAYSSNRYRMVPEYPDPSPRYLEKDKAQRAEAD